MAENKTFQTIYKNYNDLNAMMVNELELASEHDGLTGNYREQMWLKFFQSIVPRKFSIAQGVIIIDSDRKTSREVDLAVYDEQYTPYVFQYNALKFIPIEAVVMVVECKSTDYEPEKLKAWSESIKNLNSRATGIARMTTGHAIGLTNKTQKQTTPIQVLVALKNYVNESKIREVKNELGDHFDFIILEKRERNQKNAKFELLVKHESKKIGWWSKKLNYKQELKDIPNEDLELDHLGKDHDYDKFSELIFAKADDRPKLANTLQDLCVFGNPLLTLNFQLNQLLMLLNNPMLFPHFAYAKAFNKTQQEFTRAEGKKERTPRRNLNSTHSRQK
ncbi:hypothetical protein IDH44_17860 [Paenibacillus sp. IB182496]|uniref:DUF6602 domain-containing protein n=1 Tax=Paenibacillus sabuli TaxID=2772509 RepID=A0A927GTU8_9BACL|nr:DUF6602 domain-containing protein [Paenibacillus sabuli]MBD2847067.1 hypothetical protein [Paenibacillus sabuli]